MYLQFYQSEQPLADGLFKWYLNYKNIEANMIHRFLEDPDFDVNQKDENGDNAFYNLRDNLCHEKHECNVP